jgi:hypothetical protein
LLYQTVPQQEIEMKSLKFLAVLPIALAFSVAQASPVLLGSVIKDYGTAGSQTAPASQGAGSCDTMNANSVTVRAAPNCQRFYDFIDFAALPTVIGATIDNFVLTLDFTGARNEAFGFERWAPRHASSPTLANPGGFSSQMATNNGTQSWVFDATSPSFASNLVSGNFFFWMERNGGFGNIGVNLDAARLDVYGTAKANEVSLPGTLPLLGLAMAGMMAVRLGKGKKKPGQLTLSS